MLNYLKSGECKFYENDAGLLMLVKNGEDMGRVAVQRMFPLHNEYTYLSVRKENYLRSDEDSEIGIIRDLSEFDARQREIVKKELRMRYFVPKIVSIKSVKEEFGSTVWETETTAGQHGFTVTDMGTNVVNLGNNRVLLIDVYGGRYEIPDVSKIGDKAMKVLEIWL